jgi:hypothetical protein
VENEDMPEKLVRKKARNLLVRDTVAQITLYLTEGELPTDVLQMLRQTRLLVLKMDKDLDELGAA